MKSIKILVNCHKPTERLHDDIFTPILAGSAFADDALLEAFRGDLRDDMGENIARLHPYSAELTAIYWAWKNYDQLGDPDYIGLFHYRRFFNFSDRLPETDNWKCAFFDFDRATCARFGWDREHIEAVCDGAELILPDMEQILDPYDWKTPCDLETHYKHSHIPDSLDKAAALIRETHPDYRETVDATLRSREGHFCNMFIMTRELFFDYAEWLFSIILPLETLLPVTDPRFDNPEQKRVLGFLGERLFNIWINRKTRDGAALREVQRLTGYLTEADKAQFQKTYGFEAYSRLYAASKRFLQAENPVFDRSVNAENVIVHPARREGTPLVSILVPVYNVAPYLRECCESLIHQTLENIEIVFVNNASTDESPAILREYYEKDPRVTLLEHRKNEGLPGARNRALKYVRGLYFSCVDGDDVCDLTMFEKLYRKAAELQADIVTCSVFGFFESVKETYYHRPLEWFGDSDRALPLRDRPQQLMEPAAWCKLFRTDYIRGLDYFEFRTGALSWEDVPAMTSAFCQTDRIATVQEALYFYRQRRQGNMSSNMTRRHTDEFISGAILQQAILDKHNCHHELLQSYIEEFKLLYAEWSLTKMRRSDIPYFFHRVPSLFRKEDRHYLDRVFATYPHRKRFYRVLMTRSYVLYLICRFGYHGLAKLGRGGRWLLRGLKRGIKKAFNVRREDVYWCCGYGPLTLRLFNKRYYRQTADWYRGRLQQEQSARSALEGSCAALRAAKGELEERGRLLAAGQAELRQERDRLDRQSRELSSRDLALQAELRRQERELDRLADINADLLRHTGDLQREKEALRREKEGAERETAELRRGGDALLEQNRSLQRELAVRREEAWAMRFDALEAAERESSAAAEQARQENEAMRREFDGFYHAVWTTGWIRGWKTYYAENYAHLEERLKALKRGLDPESRELADRLCYRNFHLLPTQEDTDLFRFDHKRIYTPEELEGAERKLDEAALRRRWSIPADVHPEVSVFRFHCGMDFFPRKALERARGTCFIDGGASWGDSALVLSEYGPERILAFEPQPETFARLEETLEKNGLSALVRPMACGLGEREETAVLHTRGMLSGANLSGVAPTDGTAPERRDEIRLVSLDAVVREQGLRVGLIKLDIEGNELAAVRGALETIRRDRPLLAISVYHRPEDFFGIKPLLESLDLGYRFQLRKLVFHDLVTEVLLLCHIEEEEQE